MLTMAGEALRAFQTGPDLACSHPGFRCCASRRFRHDGPPSDFGGAFSIMV